MVFVLVLINAILLTCSQVLMKIGSASLASKVLWKIVFNPYIISGLCCSVMATALWIYILSKNNLGYVYPLSSLSFVFSLLAAQFILGEPVSLTRWVGIGIIIIGITISAGK